MGNKNTSPRYQAGIVERETKALQAYLAGMTYENVAKAAGYGDRSTAAAAVKRAIARRRAERDDLADEAGTVMLDKLDMLYRSLVTTALDRNNPDQYKAVDRILAVMDRTAKLQNLFAPLQVEATVRVKDELDEEIATLVRKLKEAGPADALPDTPVLDSIIDAQVVDDATDDVVMDDEVDA